MKYTFILFISILSSCINTNNNEGPNKDIFEAPSAIEFIKQDSNDIESI